MRSPIGLRHLLGFALAAIFCMPAGAQDKPLSPEVAHEIGVEAYIYFYPLLSMEVTKGQMTNVEPGKKPGFGPENSFLAGFSAGGTEGGRQARF